MRVALLLSALALTALVGFAPAPLPRREGRRQRDDLEAMQGLWRMTKYLMSGRPTSHNYKVRIQGSRWTFISLDGGRERESASYALSLDTRFNPRAFEWKSTPQSTSGFLGSYRLEGRRLTVIFGSGTLREVQNRPTDFNGAPSYTMIMEYLGR